MPMYDFKCDDCPHADIEFASMQNALPVGECLPECPKCKGPRYRRAVSLPHTDLKEFHTPIEMYSIALNSDAEIRAFTRAAGDDVRVSSDPEDPMYGVPIAASRKQKRAALKAAGFIENN
jgi:putative FmdB family regulatory protein